ncbi:MAG TPA: triose-phosphate isomerase [Salinibacter sp.]|nr:triose-phosphate isomerase [Salinibacter sp.]
MLIAGNWKMNTNLPEGRALAQNIAAGIEDAGAAFDAVDFAVCPPFVHLQAVGEALAGSPVALGGQDVHPEDEGAYTSDVSASMLTSVGCSHVIVGHSERRQYYGETDADVNRKAKQAHAHDLVPIICVGETLDQRKAGKAESVVRAQLEGALDGLTVNSADRLVVAYEPVWAIGTGESATPAQAQDMHAVIRADLQERYGEAVGGAIDLLYGGSMKPHNAAELLSEPDVDGGLIGSASLEADSFLGIAEKAVEVMDGTTG